MFPKKLFLFTFLGLILQASADQHQNFYDFASQSMSYLLDTNQDALELAKAEYQSTFQKETEAETLQDVLIDLYTTDLEKLDKNANLNPTELAEKLEVEKLALFQTHKSDLLELKHENLFTDLKTLYMNYLISYTNILIKENKKLRSLDKNTQLTYHIDINVQVEELLYNFMNEELDFQNNEDFIKSQNTSEDNKTKRKNKRINAFNNFFEEGQPMDITDKQITDEVRDQVIKRLGYAQLKVDNAYSYANKVQALMYKMTNSVEGYDFSVEDFGAVRKRMSEIAFAFYSCTLDLEKEDEKLVLFYNLKHERKHAQAFNSEEQPSEFLYAHLIEAVLKVSHSVNPELTHRHLSYILSTNLFNSGSMGPFLKKVYDNYSEDIWTNWEAQEDEDKEVNAVMMTEIFNYAVSNGETFSETDYDNFVEHFSELVNVNQAVLNYNVVFSLFSFNECPIMEDKNLDMNYTLYKYLLEFRYTEAENLLNPANDLVWAVEFDKYLDARYENESASADAKVLSYYPYMKMLNLIKMVSINLDRDVNMAELSQDVIDQLVENNNNNVCVPLNTSMNNIVRLFDIKVKKGDLNATYARLSNLVISVQELTRIFKFDVQTLSANIAQDKIDLPNYNFSAKVYTGKYRNIINQVEEKQDKSNLKNRKGNSNSEEESWVEPEITSKTISRSNSKNQSDESIEEPELDVLNLQKNKNRSIDDILKSSNSQENKKSKTVSGETGVLDFQKNLKPSSEEQQKPNYILSQIGGEILNPTNTNQKTQILKTSEQSHEMSEEDSSEQKNKEFIESKPKKNKTITKTDSNSNEGKNYPLKDTKVRKSTPLSSTSLKTDSESNEEDRAKLRNKKNRSGKTLSSGEDFSDDDENRIGVVVNPENLVEVVAGGDLTRQEMDILKNPKVLQKLKNMENGENKIVFENGDGSLTEIVYVQVVPYKSPCYDEINA